MTYDDIRSPKTFQAPSEKWPQDGFAAPFETSLGAAVISALTPYKTYYVGGCVRDAPAGSTIRRRA
jgi:hypothetical protein